MIDAHASRSHYLDQLVPIWEVLPDATRGTLYLSGGVTSDLAHVRGQPSDRRDHRHCPVLAASYGDGQAAWVKGKRKVILCEHGVGQTYSGTNPAYAGGTQREWVSLFLNPNEHTTEANRRAWPDTPSITVGLPYLDRWHPPTPRDHKTVVFSWHWRNQTAQPKGAADSAFPHYHQHLPRVFDALRSDGWEILGTAHPRAWQMRVDRTTVNLRNWYGAHGVEVVEDFAEVLDRGSVYVADQTSGAWMAASVGMGVVFLDAPCYVRAYEQDLWPRFDQVAASVGVHCLGAPGDLARMVHLAHRRPLSGAIDLTVPHRDGKSAQRAVDAICNLFA